VTQNVLGVCTFNLQFSYIYTRWEGSTNDQAVINNIIGKGLFPVPASKYYLADTGYIYSNITLSPYRGYRYHLKESVLAKAKPSYKEELFNLRYAQLRNEVERIFRVVKRRFPILGKKYKYGNIIRQQQLVYTLTGLHNFIRQNATCLNNFDTKGMERGARDALRNSKKSNRLRISAQRQRHQMEDFRDEIAVLI
jgi:hypothetical protein